MQAIVTKYYPATDTRGSRIVARYERGTLSIPYPFESSEPHAVAARALMDKLGLSARFDIVSGALPGNAGEAHVLVLR